MRKVKETKKSRVSMNISWIQTGDTTSTSQKSKLKPSGNYEHPCRISKMREGHLGHIDMAKQRIKLITLEIHLRISAPYCAGPKERESKRQKKAVHEDHRPCAARLSISARIALEKYG